MEDLIQDTEKRRALGQQLYAEIVDKFTIQKHWQEWRDVILELKNEVK